MKGLLAFIIGFQVLVSDLPEDMTFISSTKEIPAIVEKLKPGETIWLLMPLSKSYENKIIEEMAKEERWASLRNWDPPSFEDYRAIIKQTGLKSVRHGPYPLVLHGESFRNWIEFDLAPRIGLNSMAAKEFTGEFLLQYNPDTAFLFQFFTEVRWSSPDDY